jgi:hypothetical protein
MPACSGSLLTEIGNHGGSWTSRESLPIWARFAAQVLRIDCSRGLANSTGTSRIKSRQIIAATRTSARLRLLKPRCSAMFVFPRKGASSAFRTHTPALHSIHASTGRCYTCRHNNPQEPMWMGLPVSRSSLHGLRETGNRVRPFRRRGLLAIAAEIGYNGYRCETSPAGRNRPPDILVKARSEGGRRWRSNTIQVG